MFEEVAVWRRIDSKSAVRYVGFRNLDTGRVWIAFANYIGIDKDRDLSADEMIAADGMLESCLVANTADCQHWWAPAAQAGSKFI